VSKPPDGVKAAVTQGEIVSLAERMGYLQALRVGFAVFVLAAGVFAADSIHTTLTHLTLVTAAYLVLAALSEGIRRTSAHARVSVVGGMLLVDGLYLAWVVYSTGASASPLRFLVYLHLIAVTLLASYRSGLKIALWHSLLFFVVYYAQAAAILQPVGGGPAPGDPNFTRDSVLGVMTFWLVALGTAAFSSLNERDLRRRKVESESLADMAGALETQSDAQLVAQTLLEHVCSTFRLKRGVIIESLGEGGSLLAYRGPGEPVDLGQGVDAVIRKADETREPQLVKKLSDSDDHRLNALLPFARNVIVIPLVAEADPIGFMVVEHGGNAATRVHRHAVQTMTQFAKLGALALSNRRLMQKVQKLADTDALTGLANRRTFQKVLERELSRAARNGDQVTLMMLDVDHFKNFNDTHGHQAGDEVLALVAKTLGDASRDFDTAARYGGEEFAVILPSCSPKESLPVAERLRSLVGHIQTVAPVTASAGVATFPNHASDLNSLIKAADEALYESKRAGRDRITRSRRRGRRRAPVPRRDGSPAATAEEAAPADERS
jgi:diguanylate cyclase (GGDEF)-like protein